ncbi:LuxR C-terminal-related transcriptional regulator [Methylomonas sp. AM2-LC]|uniref:response regulator transcription factor n=1 Tax=Methylomonas sp. AM2-LC TaxID=3153301 RepID=UPI003263CBF3
MTEREAIYVLQKDKDLRVITPFDLTEREVEILRLLCTALSDKAIALQLLISVSTVATHVSSIYNKMGIKAGHENARIAAVLKAMQAGLFPEDIADALD